MVTGERELIHVKYEQKRKNPVKLLEAKREPEKKQKGARVFHMERFAAFFLSA